MSMFDMPSRASSAICRSCAVRSSPVSTLRLRTVEPVASSSRRALRERFHPDRREHLVRDAQLTARVDSAILPAQPLAVPASSDLIGHRMPFQCPNPREKTAICGDLPCAIARRRLAYLQGFRRC
jgi:hypothetical protein